MHFHLRSALASLQLISSELCLRERHQLWHESHWVVREPGLQLGLAFPDYSILTFHLPFSRCCSLGHEKQLRPDLWHWSRRGGYWTASVLGSDGAGTWDVGAPREGLPMWVSCLLCLFLCFYEFCFAVVMGFSSLSQTSWVRYQPEQVSKAGKFKDLPKPWSEVKLLSHVQLFATPWTVAY